MTEPAPLALQDQGPPVRLIAGPTASGKSAVALELAERTGGVIVNADALQIYRDLRVLTARPSAEDEARAPHRLYGIVDAAEAWSAGRWLSAATEVLAGLRREGRTAIVTGGTGLYFKILTEGLAEIPPIPPEVRATARRDLETLGEPAFRDRLAERDPDAAARISPGDLQRLGRAWEVVAATGRPLSAWQADTAPTLAAADYAAVAIEVPRGELYARCDRRMDAMAAGGALEEAGMLLARRLDPDLPAMKAVGLRELSRHLCGDLSLEAALDLARRETRRYAKRQLTWLRGQAADWPRWRPVSQL
ncbi:MAG TPA: tRNA (adenosine(37)-N6)-dimethylallyltransferase MiaA [Caulobacteraceae bacterium]|nr:tRNA (adenosine(37)-N6)-dimethylallyltransferase MiaA [Caulobacteraceae bacterium]